jgi:hypothetical protein
MDRSNGNELEDVSGVQSKMKPINKKKEKPEMDFGEDRKPMGKHKNPNPLASPYDYTSEENEIKQPKKAFIEKRHTFNKHEERNMDILKGNFPGIADTSL